MKRQIVLSLAACGLALGGVSFGLTAWANVDNVLGRYPGSVRLQSTGIDLHSVAQGAISRQAVYETADEQSSVKRWFAARLEISPASELYTDSTCAWLAQSKPAVWLRREVSVLLCAEPHGTRVVVNESVYLWP